jgi:DNA-binding NarL/FixJ family response regulator
MSFPAIIGLAQTLLGPVSPSSAKSEMGTSDRVPDSPLSPREREVLRLVAKGLTSKQIGQQLFLSPRTVEAHLNSIFNRLGVENRAQAVAVAVQHGVIR